MNQSKGGSIKTLIIGLAIVYTIMPIVSRFISTYLTTYFFLAVIIFIFINIIFGSRVRSMNEYIGGVLFPFMLFQCFSFFIRTDSFVIWGYSVLLNVLPVMVGYYITRYHTEQIDFFAKLMSFALIITTITTSIGLVKFPYASRILATIESSQNEAAITYNWYNIGGYEFIYMLVLLYPILIMAYKRRKINLVVATIGTVLIFATVLLSEYTTALLLIMTSSVLFFVKRNLRKKDVFILLLVALLFIVFLSDYVSQFLTYVGSLTGSDTMAERLNSLAAGQAGLEVSESNRIFLYQRSFMTFLSHPLLGTFLFGGGGVGGHSFILDTLGRYGLIGMVLLHYMYRKLYCHFIKPFAKEKGYGYVLWTFLQAILLSTINTGMWLEVLALVMPILVSKIYGYGDVGYENSMDYKHSVRSAGEKNT